MKIYRISIWSGKYPIEYVIEASNWATAVARGVRQWQKDKGKGSRTDILTIKAIKGGQLLTTEKNDN